MLKHHWILEGLAKPGKTRMGLAAALSRQPSMVTELLNGTRELKASEIPIIAEYLDVMPPTHAGMVKILGRAGGASDGAVQYALKNNSFGETPMPPGGSKDTVAIEVVGDSMRGVAQDGSLLYYEDLQKPPGDDVIGELCVVRLADDRVLVKYVHRGRGAGLFDLESATAPTLRDVSVVWAALVTAIIPSPQAKKIIRREEPSAGKRSKPLKRRRTGPKPRLRTQG